MQEGLGNVVQLCNQRKEVAGKYLASFYHKFYAGVLVVYNRREVQDIKSGSQLEMKMYFNFHYSLNSLTL